MLPTTIEKALDQPSISTLKHLAGEEILKLWVHYELIGLSTLVSVGGNITEHSAPFIAEQLIATYPDETLADFKICFQRGAMGVYGPIQRLDGVTIGVWMKKYLEEKYEAKERILREENDSQPVYKSYKGWVKDEGQLSEVGKQSLEEMLKIISESKMDVNKHPQGVKPKGTSFVPTFKESDVPAHRAYLKKTYPKITEKEIENIIDSWRTKQ